MQSRSVAEFEPRGSGHPQGDLHGELFQGRCQFVTPLTLLHQENWPGGEGEVVLFQPEVSGRGQMEHFLRIT